MQGLLAYRNFPSDTDSADMTIIALHGYGSHLDQLVPFCRAVRASAEISAPEAPREVHPYTADWIAQDLGSYWFSILHDGSPDPTRFGDSLRRLEQFVVDVVRRGAPGRPVYLLGYDQGASLALTLAGVVPDYLDGVVGICGHAPRFRNWSMPIRDLGGLNVLMVNDADGDSVSPELICNTAADLRELRGFVHTETVPGVRGNLMNAVASVSDWFNRLATGTAREGRWQNALPV